MGVPPCSGTPRHAAWCATGLHVASSVRSATNLLSNCNSPPSWPTRRSSPQNRDLSACPLPWPMWTPTAGHTTRPPQVRGYPWNVRRVSTRTISFSSTAPRRPGRFRWMCHRPMPTTSPHRRTWPPTVACGSRSSPRLPSSASASCPPRPDGCRESSICRRPWTTPSRTRPSTPPRCRHCRWLGTRCPGCSTRAA